jgi:hypothetical protein
VNKNVYSIVLTDEVIRAVDEEAYRLGTNRSNLINQVLAEHFSCTTAEMRMREILNSAEMLLQRELLLMQQNSPSVLMLRTALQYKYRPTVNYKIELERNPEEYMGRLKVQIRTQNPVLEECFRRFFEMISNAETDIFQYRKISGYEASISRDSFTRLLLNNPKLTEEEKGAVIGNYLNMLNKAVKNYFSATNEMKYVVHEYKVEFSAFIKENVI